MFRIPVAGSFTAGDVINILRNFFRLPKPATFSDENIQVSLNHSLVFDGKKVPLKNILGEVGVDLAGIESGMMENSSLTFLLNW
ncbi:hypothetical protein [Citrobacter amalonaticus]|uniref:hypothetical protein n=1 Tax=Citrobacter amalonaticus TaxID=35703 RepID=UPI0035631761